MTKLAYFNLPDVGEGLTEAEIVSWKVKPGDSVAVNQVICEIETAKSLVELPCPFAGVIAELLAAEGDTVEVGKPIISATVADGAVGAVATSAIPIINAEQSVAASQAQAPDAAELAKTEQMHSQVAAQAAEAHQAVTDAAASVSREDKQPANLVGYGAASAAGSRRRRGTTAIGISAAAAGGVVSAAASGLAAASPLIAPAITTGGDEAIIAKPPIRKLAKDLGVDLSKVRPTGTAGEVTREDVLAAASQASVFRNLSTPQPPAARQIPTVQGRLGVQELV